MTITAYPLSWPAGWKRTDAGQRTAARFGRAGRYSPGSLTPYRQLTIAEATGRVFEQLQKMGIDSDDLVISTNLELRLDGLPRSVQRAPADPGAAAYWRGSRQDGWPMRCMAIDRYDRVEDNLAAIAATLDAMRAIERHGGAEILDRAFTGFAALPSAGDAAHWSDVLGVPRTATRDEIEQAWRRLRAQLHPDRGGSTEAFQRAAQAYDEACRG